MTGKLTDAPGAGNRAFRCNYHGWHYDDEGELKQAPLATNDMICERKLATFHLAESNGFYFVGAFEPPDVSDVQTAFSEAGVSNLSAPFFQGFLDHNCNWKLLVENVLESYHLSFVHNQTFVPAGLTSTAEAYYQTKGLVSWSSIFPTQANDRGQSFRRLSSESGHYYKHAFVFPNFFLANSNGLIGFQSSLSPISAASTRVEWALFELPALKVLPDGVRDHFRKNAIEFANATLLEDKDLVESCQIGMSRRGVGYQLQPSEGRIASFHSMYLDHMNGK